MDMCRLQKWLLNVASAHCQWGRQRIGMVVGESKRAGHTVTRDLTILKQAVSALLRERDVSDFVETDAYPPAPPGGRDETQLQLRHRSRGSAAGIKEKTTTATKARRMRRSGKQSVTGLEPPQSCRYLARRVKSHATIVLPVEIPKRTRNNLAAIAKHAELLRKASCDQKSEGDRVQTVIQVKIHRVERRGPEMKNAGRLGADNKGTLLERAKKCIPRAGECRGYSNSDTHIMRQVLPTIYGLEDKLDSRWSEVYLVRRARIRTWIYSSDLRGSRHIISVCEMDTDLRGDGWDYVRPEE
ncbi:hypothetical protein C8R45DRAFT_947405 [Mycena sanguinolenta]|nr:hypothetical protein C8R45DRAFT_947405 [Mycena sanguinolenta]